MGVWVTEQVVGSAPNLDPSVMLALAAAYTSRVRLGCAVYVSTLASPLHLAKTIATLDQVSGGRLDVGLGAGGGFRAFGAFGMDREAFVGRLTEGLRLMQAAVDARSGSTSTAGSGGPRGWRWSPSRSRSRARRSGWAAATRTPFGGPARLGDGFIGAGSTMTEDYLQQARIVHEQVERQGRDPATFRVAKRVYLAVDDDPAVAQARLTEALEGLYGYFGTTGVGRVGVSGRAADVAEVLQRILDAGTDLLVLHPLYDDAEQMERLSADALPLLRGVTRTR